MAAFLASSFLSTPAAAQILDTLEAGPDSVDVQIETYFVKSGDKVFFEPHADEQKVARLTDRVKTGECRSVTVLHAANQRKAAELSERRGGEVVNVRMILRCEKQLLKVSTGARSTIRWWFSTEMAAISPPVEFIISNFGDVDWAR